MRMRHILKTTLLGVTAFLCAVGGAFAATGGKIANAAAKETEFGAIKPIISYQFDDPKDFGKDTFGIASLANAIPNTRMKRGEEGGVRFTGDSVLYADTVRNSLDFSDLLDSFTVSVWLRPLESATSRVYSSGMYGHRDGYLLLYEKADTGKSYLTFRIGFNNSENSRTWEISDPNSWQHFSFSVDAAERKFAASLNGKTVAETDMPGDLAVASRHQVFALGGFMHTGASGSYDYYNGELDDVRIYGYAMPGGTMNALAAAGRRGKLNLPLPESYIAETTPPEESVENPACADYLLLNRLPETMTVTDGKEEGEAGVMWLSVKREGSTGTALGVLMNTPYPNVSGLHAEKRFRFDEKAPLPLTLAPVFTDNLLLSRNRSKLYGTGGAGTIRAELKDGDTLVAAEETACPNGDWQLAFEGLPVYPEGLTLELTSSSQPEETITLHNIAVGEVWLASGQSNMDWAANLTANPSLSAYQQADYNNIRYFKQYATPKNEVTYPYNLGLKWDDCTVYDSVVTGDYSAYASAFALELQKSLSAREGKTIPVGIVQVAVGGSKIEQWLSAEAMAEIGRQEDDSYTPSVFYNGMLSHLLPFTFDGMIWYQGESNCNDIARYPAQFSRLVSDLRAASGAELPVISAQLVQFNQTDWPQFRQMQWDTMETVPLSYVNCGIDLGEPNDIHPQKDKYLFGSRAASIAMKYVYGDDEAAGLSPYPGQIEYLDGKVRIRMRDAAVLTPLYGNRAPDGFKVMVGGKWVAATASAEGNLVTLSGFSGKATKVSYAQFANASSYKDGFNFLYNEQGLPLAPFTLGAVQPKAAVSVLGGGAAVSGAPESIVYGGRITLSVQCPEGKRVKEIRQNGTPVYYAGGNGTFVSAPVYGDTTIEIILADATEQARHTVSANVSGKGTIDIADSESVTHGASRIYLLTPEEGYRVGKVTVNGKNVSVTGNQLVIDDIEEDMTITVEFVEAAKADGCNSSLLGTILWTAPAALMICLLIKKRDLRRKNI